MKKIILMLLAVLLISAVGCGYAIGLYGSYLSLERSLQDYVGTSVQAKVQLVVDKANEVTAKIASVLKLGMGGAITAAGRMLRFAGGGVVRGACVPAL